MSDDKYWLKRIKDGHINLNDVPKDYVTEYLKMEAVKNCGSEIRFIHNPSFELKMEAAKECGISISYMTNPEIEVIYAGVEQEGVAIKYVPEKRRSKKLCFVAVKSNGWAIKYIKDPTKAMCDYAFANNMDCFREIPIKSLKMCVKAVDYNWNNIMKVPDRFVNRLIERRELLDVV